jgi:hypothetical protein
VKTRNPIWQKLIVPESAMIVAQEEDGWVALCHASCIVEVRSEAREVQGDMSRGVYVWAVPKAQFNEKQAEGNQIGNGADISHGPPTLPPRLWEKGTRRWERVWIGRNGAFRKSRSRKVM